MGTAPGVGMGGGGESITALSDLGVRVGVAHWGAHGGVNDGLGGCVSSDTPQRPEQQPCCCFAWRRPSMSVSALSNTHFEVVEVWLDVGRSARPFTFV